MGATFTDFAGTFTQSGGSLTNNGAMLLQFVDSTLSAGTGSGNAIEVRGGGINNTSTAAIEPFVIHGLDGAHGRTSHRPDGEVAGGRHRRVRVRVDRKYLHQRRHLGARLVQCHDRRDTRPGNGSGSSAPTFGIGGTLLSKTALDGQQKYLDVGLTNQAGATTLHRGLRRDRRHQHHSDVTVEDHGGGAGAGGWDGERATIP